jgi:hypothetical protein
VSPDNLSEVQRIAESVLVILIESAKFSQVSCATSSRLGQTLASAVARRRSGNDELRIERDPVGALSDQGLRASHRICHHRLRSGSR